MKKKISNHIQRVLIFSLSLIFLLIVASLFLSYKLILRHAVNNRLQLIPTVEPLYTKIPSPEIDTSTWKTYRDPVLNFSIKYPATIEIMDGSQPGSHVDFFFRNANFSKLNASNPSVENLYITPLTGEKDPRCIPGTHCTNDPSVYKWIIINNAYGLDQSSFEGSSYNQFYVNDLNKKQSAIFIQLIVSRQFDKEKVYILEQMIRTFKFNR